MHITAWKVRFARCLTKNFHFNKIRAESKLSIRNKERQTTLLSNHRNTLNRYKDLCRGNFIQWFAATNCDSLYRSGEIITKLSKGSQAHKTNTKLKKGSQVRKINAKQGILKIIHIQENLS